MSHDLLNEERLDRLVCLARGDMLRQDWRRAKDRLRTVLREHPLYEPALRLMGHIYYWDGDYRNAVMYWSRAGHWNDPMPEACEHVFRAAGKALTKERSSAIRYYLYAFAGASPPPHLARRVSLLHSAHYMLGVKHTKRAGLTCAPISGGCLLVVLAVSSVLLNGGLSWFAWTGGIAIVTTAVVSAVNGWSYARACKLYRETVSAFVKGC